MEKLDLSTNSLKRFGIVMGAAFLIIAYIIFARHKSGASLVAIISILFFLLAVAAPAWLKYFYILWMKLAAVLGWVNTRIILFLIFYIIFAPIGLAIRLLRIDLLDRKIDKNKKSYWLKKERRILNQFNYEKPF
jgi:Saxitoxin biosynthesis operon protein SxtJ